MKILTKRQLQILKPLKIIVSEEFYELQKKSMTNRLNTKQLQRSCQMTEMLNSKQIIQCRKIRRQLEDYRIGLRGAVDMIKEGTKIIEEDLL